MVMFDHSDIVTRASQLPPFTRRQSSVSCQSKFRKDQASSFNIVLCEDIWKWIGGCNWHNKKPWPMV